MLEPMLKVLAEKIHNARSVLLSTHRQCDGDGLGAQIGLFHAFKKMGKRVRILNVDRPARKYSFLEIDRLVDVFIPGIVQIDPTDVALILDTNDQRLVEPLYSEMKNSCKEIVFLDHHPVLAKGPQPTSGSIIDVSAASTGELSFRLLQALGVDLDPAIARALYTSIVFDTQLFRFVKSDPSTHLIAAELLKFEREPEEIHRRLFSNYTVEKMAFLARAMSNVEYFSDDRIAFIPLRADAFSSKSGLDRDESGDVIDQIMNINSIEIAALLREDGPHTYKLSLRSSGTIEVLSIAETFNGGGHRYASGAYISGQFEEIRSRVIKSLMELVPARPASNRRSGV
jgi:bifunctional oligoribonuclease and PAP phosphatase NrnA